MVVSAAQQNIAPPEGRWQSALAGELAAIPRRVRSAIGLPDAAVQTVEILVRMLHTLLNDDDPRELADRATDLAPLLEKLVGDELEPASLSRLTGWSEAQVKEKLENHIHRLASPNGRRFLRQAMGAGRYDRIKQALIDDGNLVMLATRRLLHYTLPLIQALQDATVTVSATERGEFAGLAGTEQPLVQLAIQLDGVIDDFVEKHGFRIDQLDLPVRPDEVSRMQIDAEQLVVAIRMALRSETEGRIAELSDQLSRKLRGFEQALAYSEDGVSQAANSLVEFIDWLLRQAFDEAFVLQWSAQHYPANLELAYQDKANGVVRPTTHARALCFVHAGEAPLEPDTFGRLLASSLAGARRRAEKLKHGSYGEPGEADALRELMDAVRGVMTLVLRFAWGLAHADRLDYLRNRLAG